MTRPTRSARFLALAAGSLLALAAMLGGCKPPAPATPDTPDHTEPLRPTPGLPWLVDATADARIEFVHFDSATPTHTIPETMGSGVGWIDYDGDGWPDLFCVQDCPVFPRDRTGPLPTHKLYRNMGNGTFTDVTAAVGLDKSGFGMGVAVGDYDNDGFDDLVVTYLDGLALFHNEKDAAAPGGRRFRDVTAASKLNNPDWGTSCGWGDIDGDGFLDLYVCNYVRIDLAHYVPCENTAVHQYYVCPPTVFPYVSHRLFHNNGDGTFSDVTAASGVGAAPPGGGLGVILLDLDGDSKTDIYVANDMRPAYVFQNQGGGKLVDRAVYTGASLMPGGRFMAGMGVAVGDVDGTGRPSVLVSNYQDEPTMVFLNRGKMRFQEWSHPSGLGPATMKTLGFGIDLFDADLDGNLDVAIANGHVVRNSMEIYKAPYRQAPQLFLGDGRGHFKEVSATAGSYFQEPRVGRGLAVGDYNNDGLPDVVISHIGGPVKLLRNETQTPNHWVRFELVGDGKASNRNAVGARVEIEAGGRTLVRWVHGGGSYLSAHDRRLVVGLGAAERIDRVTVTWPSGARQVFANLTVGCGWRLTQGKDAAELVVPRKPG